jgi:cytochrome c biogenesis protein CcmG/thiol:disulfide interchange protein DsbE
MNRQSLRITGAALLVVLGVWAGAWLHSSRVTVKSHPGIPVPAGEASPPSSGDLVPAPEDAGPDNALPTAKIPDRLPQFSLQDLEGKTTPITAFAGKSLIINFWATWCAPCKIETPWIVELRNKYASQGFEVLGISTEGDDLKPDDKAGWAKDKAAITKFVQEEKVPYPMLVNGDSISAPYGGLDELPTSFFVNRKGVVVAAQVGLSSESDFEANIKKALAN